MIQVTHSHALKAVYLSLLCHVGMGKNLNVNQSPGGLVPITVISDNPSPVIIRTTELTFATSCNVNYNAVMFLNRTTVSEYSCFLIVK